MSMHLFFRLSPQRSYLLPSSLPSFRRLRPLLCLFLGLWLSSAFAACDPAGALTIALNVDAALEKKLLDENIDSASVRLCLEPSSEKFNPVNAPPPDKAKNFDYAVFTEEICKGGASTCKGAEIETQCILVAVRNPSHVKDLLKHKRFFLLPPEGENLKPPASPKYKEVRVTFAKLKFDDKGNLLDAVTRAEGSSTESIAFGKSVSVEIKGL